MKPAQQGARFLTGSTMYHVTVMTLTGSLGLTFMFLVDALSLFWVAQLGLEHLTSAIGLAGVLQFLNISVGIGMMIATLALTARSIGQGDRARARRIVSSSLVLNFLTVGAGAVGIYVFRYEILGALGAEGETLEAAASFLSITLPSLPIMSASFVGTAALRAVGDAWRSMAITSVTGLVALVFDPFVILPLEYNGTSYGLGLGIEGAGYVIAASRIISALWAAYFVIKVHDLASRPSLRNMRNIAKPFFGIALPGSATQLSTPVAGMIAMAALGPFGDSAIAGAAVMGRIQMVAFGGIFALSGAIGGIIGQNFGAGQMDRVKSAYLDAIKFSAIYTAVVWAVIMASSGLVADLFNLTDEGAEVYNAFAFVMAGSVVFLGAQFVSNAAFNNLNRPLWSTLTNWMRDLVLMWPLLAVGTILFGAAGAVYGQAVASIVVGVVAALWGWRYICSLAQKP